MVSEPFRKFCMLDERVDSFLVIRTTSLALLAGEGNALSRRDATLTSFEISKLIQYTLPCITPWHGLVLTVLTGGP